MRYDSTFFSEGWFREWEQLKEVLAQLLQSERRGRGILDYGCGPGIMIDRMNGPECEYVGCDISPETRALYFRHFGRHPDKHVSSLSALAGRRFDLMLSFDVLEHMRDEEIQDLLNWAAAIPEVLVNISRVRSLPGHINIKSDTGWIGFFSGRGWNLEVKRTLALRRLYLQQRPGAPNLWHRNLFLFRRAGVYADSVESSSSL